jgi:hypothetical protein
MIRDAPNVARALAAVQQRLLTSDAMDAVSRLDLAACARWSSQFFDRATATMLVEHIERVQAAPVPECWSPLDLHPTNIVVDQAGVVRFIDVDGSFRAPAPLTAALFANRCGDRSFYRTYEEAWVPRVKNVDWRPFEISAVAIETWLAWHRFERHVRTGELRGECDFAANRTRARLERALQRL